MADNLLQTLMSRVGIQMPQAKPVGPTDGQKRLYDEMAKRQQSDNNLVWPELENAAPILAGLYPEATTINIKPMGWIERNLLGGKRNLATTDLDGTINYNKEVALRDGVNPDQLLAHELQHVRQNNNRGLGENIWQRVKQGRLPWESRPDEIDAVAAENRPQGFRRKTDIKLPAQTK